MKKSLLLCLGVLVLFGCSLPGPQEHIVYTVDSPELAQASVLDGVWESSPWSSPDAPWIFLGPQVTIEMEHTLGGAPRVVLVYLAFDAAGTDPALASGHLARVFEVTDTTITVHNDSNGSYFMRTVAF